MKHPLYYRLSDPEWKRKLWPDRAWKTISFRDANARKEMKENFYHGILIGLFSGTKGWDIKSNAEAGDGYSDISIEIEDMGPGIIIELKYAEKAAFDSNAKKRCSK